MLGVALVLAVRIGIDCTALEYVWVPVDLAVSETTGDGVGPQAGHIIGTLMLESSAGENTAEVELDVEKGALDFAIRRSTLGSSMWELVLARPQDLETTSDCSSPRTAEFRSFRIAISSISSSVACNTGTSPPPQSFSLEILNVNEAPDSVEGRGKFEVAEYTPAGALLFSVRTRDPDSDNIACTAARPHTYRLVGTIPKWIGLVAADGFADVVTIAPVPTYFYPPGLTVGIESTDEGGLTVTVPFVINVTNVNQPPSFDSSISLASHEALSPGMLLPRIEASDPDPADAPDLFGVLSYSWNPSTPVDTRDIFNLDEDTGDIFVDGQVYGIAWFDLSLVATDGGGASATVNFTIKVIGTTTTVTPTSTPTRTDTTSVTTSATTTYTDTRSTTYTTTDSSSQTTSETTSTTLTSSQTTSLTSSKTTSISSTVTSTATDSPTSTGTTTSTSTGTTSPTTTASLVMSPITWIDSARAPGMVAGTAVVLLLTIMHIWYQIRELRSRKSYLYTMIDDIARHPPRGRDIFLTATEFSTMKCVSMSQPWRDPGALLIPNTIPGFVANSFRAWYVESLVRDGLTASTLLSSKKADGSGDAAIDLTLENKMSHLLPRPLSRQGRSCSKIPSAADDAAQLQAISAQQRVKEAQEERDAIKQAQQKNLSDNIDGVESFSGRFTITQGVNSKNHGTEDILMQKLFGLQLVFVAGSPSSGKTTVASHISKRYALDTITIADLIQKATSDGSKLGSSILSELSKGKSPPNDIVFELVKSAVVRLLPAEEQGFVFDGFPDSAEQVTWLKNWLGEALMGNTTTIWLECNSEILNTRFANRKHPVRQTLDSLLRASDELRATMDAGSLSINTVDATQPLDLILSTTDMILGETKERYKDVVKNDGGHAVLMQASVMEDARGDLNTTERRMKDETERLERMIHDLPVSDDDDSDE